MKGSEGMATSQEREAARIPPVYCVGCGSDSTSRSADRRSLQSAASEHVATAWRALLEDAVDQEESDIVDTLVSGGENPAQGGRMCRKCFKAYEHYQSLQKSLVSNLKKAIDVIVPTTLSSSAKRLRVESSVSRSDIPTSVLPPQASSSTSASPDVAVSCLYISNKWRTLHLGKYDE